MKIILLVAGVLAVIAYLLYRGVRYFVENQDEMEVKKHNEQGWFFKD